MKKWILFSGIMLSVSACSLDDDGDGRQKANRDGVFAATFAQAFNQEPNDEPIDVNGVKPETLDQQSYDGFVK